MNRAVSPTSMAAEATAAAAGSISAAITIPANPQIAVRSAPVLPVTTPNASFAAAIKRPHFIHYTVKEQIEGSSRARRLRDRSTVTGSVAGATAVSGHAQDFRAMDHGNGKGSSGRPDLNRGPHRPERCALPGCATPREG